MNDDQLYYFLVDKNTRNVMQIDYPSDLDEFNKILGTSEGKGDLLKDLGIILKDTARVFENPAEVKKIRKALNEAINEVANKAGKKKTATKVKQEGKPAEIDKVNLFAGLFD